MEDSYMTEKMWKDELKKYLYLLPIKEEREILQYFDEAFADYRDQGYTDNEIIEQFGDPKEVAKSMVSSYLDDNQAIEEREEREAESGTNFRSKLKRGISNIGKSVSGFCDKISASSRKKRNELNSEDKDNYEREIEEARKRQEKVREEVREEEEELRKLKKEREELAHENERAKEEKMKSGKYVEIEKETKEKKFVEGKPRTYTKAERHSFLTNTIYTLIMLAIFALGICLIIGIGESIFRDVIKFANRIAIVGVWNADAIIMLGYYILMISIQLVVMGLGLGIAVGCVKKIYKRFFVKKYVLVKGK